MFWCPLTHGVVEQKPCVPDEMITIVIQFNSVYNLQMDIDQDVCVCVTVFQTLSSCGVLELIYTSLLKLTAMPSQYHPHCH